MNPTQTIINQILQENGQNTKKDAERAANLDRDINTGFTSQGCFIYELLQNADDQLGQDSEVHFDFNQKELIFYHHGTPFEEKDVRGICSYGNVKDNEKNNDSTKSGYKDIGFKSVFRAAHRVDILSNKWQFNFDEKSPRWKKGGYPWQIAPIWTEDKDLSQKAKSINKDGRTTFVFQLRVPGTVLQELNHLKLNPERILFLKNIRTVTLSLSDKVCKIYNKNNELYVDNQKHSAWSRINAPVAIPQNIKNFLKGLGDQECPKRLKDKNEVTLSIGYSNVCLKPSTNLFSTLPTGEHFGFPFVVDAPFLLNPSRERLIENEWNVFIIQSIALYNFTQVRDSLNAKKYQSLRFLAFPYITSTIPAFQNAFSQCMNQLLMQEPLIPAEFGPNLIKPADCQIDEKGLYHAFHEAGVITEGPKDLVHADVDRNQIKLRNPKVTVISLKELLKSLPEKLVRWSKDCSFDQSQQIIRLIFALHRDGTLEVPVLKALRGIFLFTKSNKKAAAASLLMPDCYKPSFSFQTHFPENDEYFLSENYLQKGEEQQWNIFFSKLGVLQECKIFLENETRVIEILGDPYINFYLNKFAQRPQNRDYFIPEDVVNKFAWFPLRGINHSESYNLIFWKSLQKLQPIGKGSFHAYHKKEHDFPIAFLPFALQNYKLIPDQNGTFRNTNQLYAPSMTAGKTPMPKTAYVPVVLSKELENWLGFQDNLSVEDCHELISSQIDGFVYEEYKFYMQHLLNNLRKSKQEAISKPWKFYTKNATWESPDQLKYWADPSSNPPQDEQQWIESVLSPEDMEELCDYFSIPETADYEDHLDLAKPDEKLQKHIKGRLTNIVYAWKSMNTNRSIKDCYQQIVNKINALTFLMLPEDYYFEGQAFIKDEKLYYSYTWEDNRKLIAKVIGEYLSFTENEIKQLEPALNTTLRLFLGGKLEAFNQFKIEFETYKPSNSNKIQTPPESPRGPLKKVPLVLDNEPVILPQIPSPEQPSQPTSTKKYTSKTNTPSSTPSGTGNKTKSPPKEPTEEDKIRKKEIGMWAEQHIVWNKVNKYKNLLKVQPIENSGLRSFITDKNVIEIDWKNDPKNRPEGRKDDILWDSGSPFDIEIVKKTNAVVTKRKKIEVKGTPKDNIHFFLGSSEWLELSRSEPKTYQIYVVTNAKTTSPYTTKYKDPLEDIKSNEFSYISKTEFTGPKIEPEIKLT